MDKDFKVRWWQMRGGLVRGGHSHSLFDSSGSQCSCHALVALTAVARLAYSVAALPRDALEIVALVMSLPLQVLTISSATGITVR
jgi:hypothetical protein